jgi:hypothetical protein
VITQLHAIFEVNLSLRDLFDALTVARLADVLLQDPSKKLKVEKTAQLMLKLAELSEEEVDMMLVEKTLLT